MPFAQHMRKGEIMEKTKYLLGVLIFIGLSPILMLLLGLLISLVMQWFSFGFSLSPTGVLVEWGVH